jgi:hypothetical protein
MPTVKFSRNGVEVNSEALLRMEAARARQMMSLLMRKLGPKGISDLFADEIAAYAADEMQWHRRSNGEFAESVGFADVSKGSADEFINWFVAGYNDSNAPAMQRAHPEHLGAMLLPDGRVIVVEVPGHTNHPAYLYLRILQDWSGVPIALDPEMPHRMMGRMENSEGEPIGYLLHQFSDTHPGFRAKLAIYWPAATPDELVKGHADHLMIEFNNWIQMYLHTRSQAVDLMPIALTCGLWASAEFARL